MTRRMDNLQDVHPRLVEAVKRMIHACHELGIEPVVVEGVSATPAHRKRSDGYGYAVRMAFRINGQPSIDPTLPWWGMLSEMARSQGLRTFVEPPHFELPSELLH
jgi:hypothetical protein